MDPWSNTATDTGNYPYLSFFLFLSIYLSLSLCLSLSHSLIISSFNKIQYSLDSSLFTKTEIKPKQKKKKKNTAPGSSGSQGGETHTSHIRSSLERFMKLSGLFSFLSPFFSFLLTVRGRPFDVRTHVERTHARISLYIIIKYRLLN